MPLKRRPEEAFGKQDQDTPIKRKRRSRKHDPEGLQPTSKPNIGGAVPILKGEPSKIPSASKSAASQLIVRKKKSSQRDKKHKSKNKPAQNGWSLSAGIGGIFLNQDPILTQDEQYLILPTACTIQIYSTATSLLVRSLDVCDEQFITTCCLSPSEPNTIFVATSQRLIEKWDWTSGRKIHEWRWRSGPLWILGALGIRDGHGDQVLLLHQHTGGQREISRCSLGDASEEPCARKTVLSSSRSVLPTSRASPDGQILVLCAGNKLLLGKMNQRPPSSSDSTYIWREATVPGAIVSMDVRFGQQKTNSAAMRTTVDVVLGFRDGTILIYEDILQRLLGKEKGSKTADIISRRLHWHRDAVKTVKWSRDGNYIISGGGETVLVIWQLDTNQKQYLPHLSTSILNLTVSAAGSSYALRLADNSVMVLSTADLKPFANISNLALNRTTLGRLPVVLHPQHNDQLVAAVPRILIPSHNQNQRSNATLLQTFDIGAGLQLNRQALTRNVITTLNVAPTGHQVAEPDVTFLQISHDGQWLITIDEWTAPAADLDPMFPSSEESSSKQKSKETCLRFWHWREDGQHWELVTRVDEPHSKSALLGLAVNPDRLEAATVGSDGVLRLWTPKLRSRSGVPVKDRFGEQLQTWTCSSASQIEVDVAQTKSSARKSAALAYSEDGSVIAASWSVPSEGLQLIHFIDSHSATLCLSQPHLVKGEEAEFAFLGRYLLCLSQEFCIWDPVNSTTTFALALGDVFKTTTAPSFLAVNKANNTFALGFNSRKSKAARIAIFDIHRVGEGPLSQVDVPNHIKLLLSRSHTLGFVVVDEQNQVRQITAPGSTGLSTSLVPAQREALTNSLNNIFGSGAVSDQRADGNAGEERRALPAPEVRAGTRSIEDLLGFSAATKPSWSMGDLFQKVAGLFARPTAA